MNEKNKPSISVKEAELKIFDNDYLEVHDRQEIFKQDKNIKFKTTYSFPRIHTRVLQSSYSMQEKVIFETFDLATIAEFVNHFNSGVATYDEQLADNLKRNFALFKAQVDA